MKKDLKKCNDVMTKDPLFCEPNETAVQAAQVMEGLDVGSVPIVENTRTRKLIGIVTDRDLALKVVAAELNPPNVKVEDVMTREPLNCNPDDDLDKAIQLMGENQLRRIPVIDKAGAIVGIIAQADVAMKTDGTEKIGKVVEQISKPRVPMAQATTR